MNSERLRVLISPGGSGKPDTPKLTQLAEVARSKGLYVEIFNCEEIPDPEQRVEKLLNFRMKVSDRVILAGSSMGGYVSTVAAETVTVDGLFLLSPVLYLEPYLNLDPYPKATSITIVHGWDDDIVAAENICRFAQKFNATVHFVPGGHSLHNHLDLVGSLFGLFLEGILKKTKAEPGRVGNGEAHWQE